MPITISSEEYDEFAEALDYIDCDIDPTADYSGRAMYGDTCVGFTTDDADPFRIGFMLGKIYGEHDGKLDWLDDAGSPRQDSMGRGVIVYWPRVQVESEDD